MHAIALFAALCVTTVIAATPSSEIAGGLAHDDFAVREASMLELANRWPQSESVLREAAASENPEVSRRAYAAERLGRMRTDPQRIAARRIDTAFPRIEHFPFIDSFWYDPKTNSYTSLRSPFEQACYVAYNSYVSTHGYNIPANDLRPFLGFRAASRRLAIEWVRDYACPIWILRLFFGVLAQRDAVFLQNHDRAMRKTTLQL